MGFLVIVAALALDAVPSISAVRAVLPPHIDGNLEEQAWEQSGRLDTVLTQYGPNPGLAMSDPTSVMFLYDEENLYAGFVLFDSRPDEMNDALSPRDNYYPGEWIALLLDTWDNGRQAFSFEVNLAGSQMDSRLSPEGDWDYSWDAVWSAATARRPDGWSVEVAIPLSCLRFPEEQEQTWGFNIQRILCRTGENGWLVLSASSNQADLDNFAELTGLTGLSSSVGIEVRPYAAGRGLQPGSGVWDGTFDAGVDIKAGISSSVVADLTVNPDFGQVEADEEQMNLTHFELFRSEKRPFFLEGGDIFDMPLDLFYSRRIGAVTPLGEPIPIIGGAKLTGRTPGGFTFGLLDAVTDRMEEDDGTLSEPLENFGILRLRQDFDAWSYLGLSATSVDIPAHDSAEAGFERAMAADGKLLVTDEVVVGGEYGRTWDSEGEEGGAWSLGAAGMSPDLYWEATSTTVEDEFDANAAGFTTATGQTSNELYVNYSFEPGGVFGRSDIGVGSWYGFDDGGRVLARGVDLESDWSFISGGHLGGSLGWSGARFDRYEGPEGREYPRTVQGGISASTDWYSPYSAGCSFDIGQFEQEGRFRSVNGHLTANPVPSVRASLECMLYETEGALVYNWEAEDWDSRDTDWRSLVGRVSLMLSPDASLRLFTQLSDFEMDYSLTGSSSSREFTANLLGGLQYLPGSMVYLLAQISALRNGDASWGRAAPGVFAKVTWFMAV